MHNASAFSNKEVNARHLLLTLRYVILALNETNLHTAGGAAFVNNSCLPPWSNPALRGEGLEIHTRRTITETLQKMTTIWGSLT